MSGPPRGAGREESSRSPFRGLESFSASEEDAALFFGRDRERQLIIANLLASRLTLLYGQSGIGKSSLLCAGVVNGLRGTTSSADGPARVAVVYVSEWHGDPETAIVAGILEEARRLTGAELPERDVSLEQALDWCRDRLDAQLLLILDHFEQYFLHHPAAPSEPFDRSLTDAIVRADVRLHCLISLREDSLVGLDRFKGQIPKLFGNRLRLEGLSAPGALEAIRGPVDRYNERLAPGEPPIELDAGLPEAIVGELQELVSPLARARGAPARPARAQAGEAQAIEPAHLQLVMEALWQREAAAGSRRLRRATLTAMGGCEEIVRSHVEAGLASLPPKQRAIAAEAIRYLVTPSGVKVAHTPGDLADYVDAPEPRVEEMLERLCALRIMRPLPPAEGSLEGRYEVFHDLLAEPMLEWRTSFEAQRLRLRMRWLLAALSAAVAVGLAMAAYSSDPAPLHDLELSSIDARFAVRGTIRPNRDIVIVDVDSRTLDALNHGESGTPMRPYYAKLIDLLDAGKPKVIGVDVEFFSNEDDTALLDAIGRADGRIVLVSEEFDSEGDVPLFGERGEGGASELLAAHNHAQVGFGGFPLDPGKVYRRMGYAAPICESKYPNPVCEKSPYPLLGFSAAVAEIAEGHALRPFAGSTLIDYHGPPHTFPGVPMLDVLRGAVKPSFFTGKIVLIGVSAPAGEDLHRTPFTSGETMPGVEIQANAISTVRHGPALRGVGSAIAFLLILALSLTALLVALLRWWAAAASFIAVAGAYLLLAQLLFDGGVYVPLVYPLLALALAGAGTLLARLYLARQSGSRPRSPAGAVHAAGAIRATGAG